ncbi:O-antigen polymerase [Shewanella seohaensis]|uniref:O-antigen polymerase n=1 Tax=Shewanella seohaensis TaxID=755175 RepID=UPI0035B94B4F
MLFSKKKLKIISIFVVAVFLFCISLNTVLSGGEYSSSKIIIYWSLFIISVFIFTRKNLFIFEPVILFSFYYYFIYISAAHMISTDFQTNIYIASTSFNTPLITLFEKSLLVCLAGYLCVITGYLIFSSQDCLANVRINNSIFTSKKILYAFIICGSTLGISNFSFNVLTMAGGNVVQYISTVAVRHSQYESTGGTAVLYNLLYISCYLWFFILMNFKRTKLEFITFVLVCSISLVMWISQGRIFLTISYFFSFFGIYYSVLYFKHGRINNIKFFAVSFMIVFSGLIFYFLRVISSLNENDMLDSSLFYYLSQFLSLDMLGYYAVDKGNIPNLAVLMKIIDGWEDEIGFLYGSTLFTWVMNLLPSSIRPDYSIPSVLIKERWFSHIVGGNLPPTGLGEMFANLGYVGVFIGMTYFGVLCSLMNKLLIHFNNYWFLTIYIILSIHFFALYPKVEFQNLQLFIPILLITTVFIINKISEKLKIKR